MSGNNFQLTLRIDKGIDKWKNGAMQLNWNRTLIFEYFEGEKSTYLFAFNAFVSLCCFGLALKISSPKEKLLDKIILNILINRYRRGLDTCPQAKTFKSERSATTLYSSFFPTRSSDEYDSASSRKYSHPFLIVFACIG